MINKLIMLNGIVWIVAELTILLAIAHLCFTISFTHGMIISLAYIAKETSTLFIKQLLKGEK